jgi:hypothetical protein
MFKMMALATLLAFALSAYAENLHPGDYDASWRLAKLLRS